MWMIHMSSAASDQRSSSRDKRAFRVSGPSQHSFHVFNFPKTDVSTKMQTRVIALFLSSPEGRISDTVH